MRHTVKAKDIKVGDVIADYGLITNIDIEGIGEVWESPNISEISWDDPYHGLCSRRLDLEKKYEVVTGDERKEFLLSAKVSICDHVDSLQDDLTTIDKWMEN